MAVNHYSADSAPRSLLSLNIRPAKADSAIPLEVTRFPFLIPISKVPVPASSDCVIADNVSAYLGNADSPRRLAEHTEPALTRTLPSQTSID